MMILSFLWMFVVGLLCVAAVMAAIIIPILAFSSTNPWFCNRLGWHRNRDIKVFETSPDKGVCQRCNKAVTKDSFGNWE